MQLDARVASPRDRVPPSEARVSFRDAEPGPTSNTEPERVSVFTRCCSPVNRPYAQLQDEESTPARQSVAEEQADRFGGFQDLGWLNEFSCSPELELAYSNHLTSEVDDVRSRLLLLGLILGFFALYQFVRLQLLGLGDVGDDIARLLAYGPRSHGSAATVLLLAWWALSWKILRRRWDVVVAAAYLLLLLIYLGVAWGDQKINHDYDLYSPASLERASTRVGSGPYFWPAQHGLWEVGRANRMLTLIVFVLVTCLNSSLDFKPCFCLCLVGWVSFASVEVNVWRPLRALPQGPNVKDLNDALIVTFLVTAAALYGTRKQNAFKRRYFVQREALRLREEEQKETIAGKHTQVLAIFSDAAWSEQPLMLLGDMKGLLNCIHPFLVAVAPAATLHEAKEKIGSSNSSPRLLLFAGHGSHKGGLFFDDENGEGRLVKPEELVDMLAGPRKNEAGSLTDEEADDFEPSQRLEVIFLNCCYGAELGAGLLALLARGTPREKALAKRLKIVCWEKRVLDTAARAFAKGFFDTLSELGRFGPEIDDVAATAAAAADVTAHGMRTRLHVREAFDAGRKAFYKAGFKVGDPDGYLKAQPKAARPHGTPRLLSWVKGECLNERPPAARSHFADSAEEAYIRPPERSRPLKLRYGSSPRPFDFTEEPTPPRYSLRRQFSSGKALLPRAGDRLENQIRICGTGLNKKIVIVACAAAAVALGLGAWRLLALLEMSRRAEA